MHSGSSSLVAWECKARLFCSLSVGLPPRSHLVFVSELPLRSMNQRRWFRLPTLWCLVWSDGSQELSGYADVIHACDSSERLFRLAWVFYPGGCLHMRMSKLVSRRGSVDQTCQQTKWHDQELCFCTDCLLQLTTMCALPRSATLLPHTHKIQWRRFPRQL